MNAGRRHNADPRWLLPLICRYGHVGRNEIGAIRVAANESYFEVTERATPGFIKALRRATIAPEDEGLIIEQAEPRGEATTAQAAADGPHPQQAEMAGQEGRDAEGLAIAFAFRSQPARCRPWLQFVISMRS